MSFKISEGYIQYANITLEYLKKKLENNYCVIPIKKGGGSHLVVLREIDGENVGLVDNKKGEFTVSVNEFEDLINLYNGKYVLFVKK